jgi:putative SOS response-associated peptidase YedK
MTQTGTGVLFGDGREDIDIGPDAGAGRPGQVIRLHPKTHERHMDWLTWGLITPKTAGDTRAPRPIHARAETVTELPMFAEAFRKRRAIVPATAYFQRRTRGSPPLRYAITRQDSKTLAIAGLWEAFPAEGGIVRTYCIITVEATGAVAEIHDRMPLVLEERDWPLWLGEVPGDVSALLHPPPNDALAVRPMTKEKSGQV